MDNSNLIKKFSVIFSKIKKEHSVRKQKSDSISEHHWRENNSQSGQDYIVEEFFGYKKEGFFVELGATNGKFYSNTLRLESEHNWQGICIEPNSYCFEKLIKNRTCICDNSCIDSEPRIVDFVSPDRGFTGWGGIVSDDCFNKPDNHKVILYKDSISSMNTVRLDSVLDKYNAPSTIDYFSLDVEGSEYRVLKNFPFHKYKFLLMNVEKCPLELRKLLEVNGYIHVGRYSIDDYFIHSSCVGI